MKDHILPAGTEFLIILPCFGQTDTVAIVHFIGVPSLGIILPKANRTNIVFPAGCEGLASTAEAGEAIPHRHRITDFP